MPKAKTRKSLVSRVKITARGKVKRYRPGSGHLKSRKTNKQLRRFRRPADVSKAFAKHAKQCLGR